MSTAGSKLQSRLAELRRQFDDGFARPQQILLAPGERMLAITVAGEPLAVRVAETSGLAVLKANISPVPSSVPELLGLTGVRGAVVPVFSLAALLNSALRESEPRWLLFAGRQSLVAFAFGQLEHQFEAEAAQVFPQAGHYGRYVSETVRDGTRLRCLIRLGALAEHIRNRGSKNSL